MSHKIHRHARRRVKAGWDRTYDGPWFCLNPLCGRQLPHRYYLCRKRKACPGRVRDKLEGRGSVKTKYRIRIRKGTRKP